MGPNHVDRIAKILDDVHARLRLPHPVRAELARIREVAEPTADDFAFLVRVEEQLAEDES